MKTFLMAATMGFLLTTSGGARAQIPVTDVLMNVQTATNSAAELASMAKQLAEQIRTYTVMYNQLMQQKAAYDAIIGGRGMELLLGGQLNEYLPADITAMRSMASSARAAYEGAAMATTPQGKLMAVSYGLNSILPPPYLAAMPPNEREIIYAQRDHSAVLSSTAEMAYVRAQKRVAHLRDLQAAIKTATDPAARSELQTAIAIEQAAIANEQNQLLALAQASRAEELAMTRRMNELRIANIGRGADLKHGEF